MTTTPMHRISPPHEETLSASAIDIDFAKQWGIRSVNVASDLAGTDLDTPGNKHRTGLLFPLRRYDGSVTYQMRLDEPEGDRKYVQASDTGSIINIPAMMEERMETAQRVLVVEGTKQTIAACRYAAEDMLVVGIQGARNWSFEGVPLPVLAELFRKGRQVIIGFDADWQENPHVWEAAKHLKGHADTVSGNKTRLIVLTGGGKIGLDDYLGAIGDPEQRPDVLESLIKNSVTSLGRRPAAKKATHRSSSKDAKTKIDFDNGRITKTETDPTGTTTTEVILQAAARIIAAEAMLNEETGQTGPQTLTLEVFVPVDEDSGHDVDEQDKRTTIRTYEVKIPSSQLATVGEWIDLLPGGIGVAIPRESKPNDAVANAIREVNPDYESILVVPHTGWTWDPDGDDENTEGVWRWVDGSGAIGPKDRVNRLRGQPSTQDFQGIELPAPPEGPAQLKDYRKQVRNLLMARNYLNPDRRFAWDAAVASWGLSFLGVPPSAALCYFGQPSSGKSTIAQAITSSLNPAWAPRSGSAMATFNASPAGMDLLPNGMRDVFLHVDDLKPETDRRGMEATLKAFDTLLRRAHGSGGAVRGTVSQSTTGLGVRKIDSAAPMMIVTGEEIPSGDGFAQSGLDRALFITVEPGTLFEPDNLRKFEELARSGELRKATSAYVTWIADRIATQSYATGTNLPEVAPIERKDAWRAYVEELRGAFVSDSEEPPEGVEPMFPEGSKVSSRAKMLAASMAVGMHMVLNFARELKAIKGSTADKIWAEFSSELHKAVTKHTSDVMGGNASPADMALQEIRNAVSSNEVTLDPTTPNKPLIGEYRDDLMPDGSKAVAINHGAAAKALRWPGGAGGLQRALAQKSEPTSDGKRTRTVHINGTRVQVCVISEANWGNIVMGSPFEL